MLSVLHLHSLVLVPYFSTRSAPLARIRESFHIEPLNALAFAKFRQSVLCVYMVHRLSLTRTTLVYTHTLIHAHTHSFSYSYFQSNLQFLFCFVFFAGMTGYVFKILVMRHRPLTVDEQIFNYIST